MNRPVDTSSVEIDGLDPERVRKQVARIVGHASFAAAPQLARLLQYLVENALSGNVRELKEYSLGVAVFDRGAAFDPRTDTIVRANVRRLRRRLEEYYAGPGRDDPILIELPKGHYLARFGWNQATPGVAASASPGRPAGWGVRLRWVLAAGVVIAATLASSAYFRAHVGAANDYRPFRAALFRFDVPPGDVDAGALADAIANELVATMNAHGFGVISQAEFESLGARARLARASELGAGYAVTGEIMRDGGDLVAAVRIDHLASRTTLWAESYRRPVNSAATLRLQVATQATDILRCASPDPHARGFGGWFDIAPDDVESLRMILEVCSNIRTWRYAENLDLLRTLVARAPDSAELHAALALSLVGALSSTPPEVRGPLLTEAERAARRAMVLSPDRGAPYMALTDVRKAQGAPPGEIEAILRGGLGQVPDHATLNSYYGAFLEMTGRIADATLYRQRAIAGDPLSPGKKLGYAVHLFLLGRLAEAERVLEDGAARWPSADGWRLRMLVALIGDPQSLPERIADPPVAPGIANEVDCWRAIATANAATDGTQRRREGIHAVDRCAHSGALKPPLEIELRIAFDDLDGIFARADSFDVWNDPGVGSLLRPQLTALHRDPRFVQLLRRLGLFDAWVESGRWPDFCRSQDLPFDCRAAARG